jgi:hypothetical protein
MQPGSVTVLVARNTALVVTFALTCVRLWRLPEDGGLEEWSAGDAVHARRRAQLDAR